MISLRPASLPPGPSPYRVADQPYAPAGSRGPRDVFVVVGALLCGQVCSLARLVSFVFGDERLGFDPVLAAFAFLAAGPLLIHVVRKERVACRWDDADDLNDTMRASQ